MGIPNFEEIESSYEARRKESMRQQPRLIDVFPDISERIESILKYRTLTYPLTIELDVEWRKGSKNYKKGEPWKHYHDYLFAIKEEGWREFSLTVTSKDVERPRIGYKIKIPVKPVYYGKRIWKNATIKKVVDFNKIIFHPKSIHLAENLRFTIKSEREVYVDLAFKSRDSASLYEIPSQSKIPYRDAITEEDMPLVLDFYWQTCDYVLKDIENRGLFVRCAVREGESLPRKNDNKSNILVVRNSEEIGELIRNYHAFEFIPDINRINESYPSRIVWDLDPPLFANYKEFSDFANEFNEWLKARGFNTKLRKTGGKGVHIISEMEYNDVPVGYVPFPRSTRFETRFLRSKEIDKRKSKIDKNKSKKFDKRRMIQDSLIDLLRLTFLGFAYERKKSKGKGSKITIEKENVGKRLWNIYCDWSAGIVNTGVRSLGSIHHKTGNVCIPIKRVPSRDTVREIIKVSNDPEIEVPKKFDPKYKNVWIYLVGNYPYLLHEPSLPETSMSAVSDIFQDFGWMVRRYNENPEKFLAKYCWP